jgi:beta-galactosidase
MAAIWNIFDFASGYRNEASEPGLNTKGIITNDRSIRKDAFWFYKANWSQSPVVYLTSRRYTNLPTASTTIKAYSNQSELELTLNGTSLGKQTSMNHIFQWTNVSWASGANQASVTATSGCTSTDPMACSDQVTWMN